MSKIVKECLNCKEEFSSYQSQKRKYCSVTCKNEHQSILNSGENNPNSKNGTYTPTENICKTCGDSFIGFPNRIYCSVICKVKDQDKSVLWSYDKSGEGNPNWKGDLMLKFCPYCKKEYRAKLSTQTYCSRECYTSQRREKMLNGHAAYMNTFIQNPSRPQLELYENVKVFEPTAILNYPSLNYSIDIAIPNKMIAIEYDGSYWHNEEYDRKRQNELEEIGWKFIRYVDEVPDNDRLSTDLSCV